MLRQKALAVPGPGCFESGDMDSFTPIASTLGGLLIGLAAAGLLMFHGRIAGISGIAGGIFRRQEGDTAWRVMFLVGLFSAGVAWSYFRPADYVFGIERSTTALIIAGLAVGIGTQLGSGCTSGHGVCGIGRLSKRSTVATATFMLTAAITVFVVNEVLGGAV
jgi:uncharacterized membrane protein YedE/YeeE